MKKTMTLLAALCIGLFAVSCCNNQTKTAGGATPACCQASEGCGNCSDSTCVACPGECCQTKCDSMKYQSAAFLYESELEWQSPVVGLKRQIMGYNDNLMLVKIDFEAGCDGGGQHAHAHSQSSVVVSGVFEMTIDGVTKTLKAGDGFYVAPNLMHGAVCVEAGTLIDAFSPIREDFLK